MKKLISLTLLCALCAAQAQAMLSKYAAPGPQEESMDEPPPSYQEATQPMSSRSRPSTSTLSPAQMLVASAIAENSQPRTTATPASASQNQMTPQQADSTPHEESTCCERLDHLCTQKYAKPCQDHPCLCPCVYIVCCLPLKILGMLTCEPAYVCCNSKRAKQCLNEGTKYDL